MPNETTADALNKAVDASIAGIEKLTATIEKVAPDAWQIAVKQQVLEGWFGVVIGVLLILLAIAAPFVAFKLSRKIVETDRRIPGDDIIPWVWLIVVLAIALIPGGMGIGYLNENIPKIMNPQYYAAKEIITAIKPCN